MMRMRGWVGMFGLSMLLASCVVVHEAPDQGRPGFGRSRAPEGFSERERRAVQAYFAETHRARGCPPGLAKKRNGCQPPGLVKKRYATGRPLPAGVEVLPLPRELEIRIGRPPRGYRYGMLDGDVVKLVVGSLLVIDAIHGLGS